MYSYVIIFIGSRSINNNPIITSLIVKKTNLRFREMKGRRELSSLGDAQVLSLDELLLEGQKLLGREGRPGLPVGLVLPEVALKLCGLAVFCNQTEKPNHFNVMPRRCFLQKQQKHEQTADRFNASLNSRPLPPPPLPLNNNNFSVSPSSSQLAGISGAGFFSK